MEKNIRREELDKLMVQMTEEAISVRLDYQQSGSNLDSYITTVHCYKMRTRNCQI